MGLVTPDSREGLHQLLQECTVRVHAGTGTGFFVARSLVVTCAHVVHVVAPGDKVSLQWGDATIHGQLAAKLPHPYTEGSFPDVALIKIEDDVPEHPCVLLDFDEDYRARDPLYTWGYTKKNPAGESVTPNCEGEGRRAADARLIKFRAAQTLPGMSGAPLLNDRSRRVCGMIKFTRDDESDLGGWAIRAGVIFEHFPELRELQDDYHRGHTRWKLAEVNAARSSQLNPMDQLVKALLGCRSVLNRDIRQVMFEPLDKQIFERLVRSDIALDDVSNAVQTCSTFAGGLAALVEIVVNREGGTIAAQALQRVSKDLGID